MLNLSLECYYAVIWHKKGKNEKLIYAYTPISEGMQLSIDNKIVQKTTSIAEPLTFKVGDKIHIIKKIKKVFPLGIWMRHV